MARPPKNPDLRMDKDLRIPVTAEQRETVNRAAQAAGQDMAAWARSLLLTAARRQLKNR
jgi:hypothetical protein